MFCSTPLSVSLPRVPHPGEAVSELHVGGRHFAGAYGVETLYVKNIRFGTSNLSEASPPGRINQATTTPLRRQHQ